MWNGVDFCIMSRRRQRRRRRCAWNRCAWWLRTRDWWRHKTAALWRLKPFLSAAPRLCAVSIQVFARVILPLFYRHVALTFDATTMTCVYVAPQGLLCRHLFQGNGLEGNTLQFFFSFALKNQDPGSLIATLQKSAPAAHRSLQ